VPCPPLQNQPALRAREPLPRTPQRLPACRLRRPPACLRLLLRRLGIPRAALGIGECPGRCCDSSRRESRIYSPPRRGTPRETQPAPRGPPEPSRSTSDGRRYIASGRSIRSRGEGSGVLFQSQLGLFVRRWVPRAVAGCWPSASRCSWCSVPAPARARTAAARTPRRRRRRPRWRRRSGRRCTRPSRASSARGGTAPASTPTPAAGRPSRCVRACLLIRCQCQAQCAD
jgi:hypothetical protein